MDSCRIAKRAALLQNAKVEAAAYKRAAKAAATGGKTMSNATALPPPVALAAPQWRRAGR
jgi:hypothetical protein